MAFTRATIRNLAKDSGVEIPKELEDALVSEHLTARDAYAEEQVKAELAKQPTEKVGKVEDSEEYKNLTLRIFFRWRHGNRNKPRLPI